MILNKIKNRDGFTLVEMLVVIGLISVIGTAFSFFDFKVFKEESLKSEVELLATTLETARERSLNSINNSTHGVAIYPNELNSYIIFEGKTYESSDKSKNVIIDSNYKLQLSPTSVREILFEKISGSIVNSGNISIINSDGIVIEIINTNHEGAIHW